MDGSHIVVHTSNRRTLVNQASVCGQADVRVERLPAPFATPIRAASP